MVLVVYIHHLLLQIKVEHLLLIVLVLLAVVLRVSTLVAAPVVLVVVAPHTVMAAVVLVTRVDIHRQKVMTVVKGGIQEVVVAVAALALPAQMRLGPPAVMEVPVILCHRLLDPFSHL